MNQAASKTWLQLAADAKSCYKQLFVKGTRIRARVLYGLFKSAEEPMTPEQIAADYSLPLEAVNEAIAYCEGNPPEIAEDFEREERLMRASGITEPDYRQRRAVPSRRARGRRSHLEVMRLDLDDDTASSLLVAFLH